MGIELGLVEILTGMGALTTGVVTMALWFKKMLSDEITSLKKDLTECELKHLESAIKVAALEAKVETLQGVEHTTSRIVSEIQHTLASTPCRYKPEE